MTSWGFEIPDGLPRLSLNGSNKQGSWHARHQAQTAWRQASAAAARAARIPFVDRASVAVEWVMPDRRRRDPDGGALVAKAVIDGLVDAAVLPDDSWRHVTGVTVRFVEPDDLGPRWRVTVET